MGADSKADRQRGAPRLGTQRLRPSLRDTSPRRNSRAWGLLGRGHWGEDGGEAGWAQGELAGDQGRQPDPAAALGDRLSLQLSPRRRRASQSARAPEPTSVVTGRFIRQFRVNLLRGCSKGNSLSSCDESGSPVPAARFSVNLAPIPAQNRPFCGPCHPWQSASCFLPHQVPRGPTASTPLTALLGAWKKHRCLSSFKCGSVFLKLSPPAQRQGWGAVPLGINQPCHLGLLQRGPPL